MISRGFKLVLRFSVDAVLKVFPSLLEIGLVYRAAVKGGVLISALYKQMLSLEFIFYVFREIRNVCKYLSLGKVMRDVGKEGLQKLVEL